MKCSELGNLNKKISKKPSRNGWFAGHFMDSSSLLKNNEVELKWGVHKKGEKYLSLKKTKKAKSLAIMIKGKIRISFPDLKKKIILSKMGDYAIWDKEIFHTSEFLEDTTMLTVRWPSLANDNIEKKIKNNN
jgi:hypothetical protein